MTIATVVNLKVSVEVEEEEVEEEEVESVLASPSTQLSSLSLKRLVRAPFARLGQLSVLSLSSIQRPPRWPLPAGGVGEQKERAQVS